MQLLLDFFPLIVFFVAFVTFDIYVATAAIIAAFAIQIAYQWLRHRKVSKMLLISGALVAVFGGLTLVLRDVRFIQYKVTVVNWLFALGFLGSQFIGQKTFVEHIMGHAIQLERSFWRQLNMLWVLNFAVLGALNLYIMFNHPEAWPYFKSVGMIGLSLLMAVGQAIWISSRVPNTETDRQP